MSDRVASARDVSCTELCRRHQEIFVRRKRQVAGDRLPTLLGLPKPFATCSSCRGAMSFCVQNRSREDAADITLATSRRRGLGSRCFLAVLILGFANSLHTMNPPWRRAKTLCARRQFPKNSARKAQNAVSVRHTRNGDDAILCVWKAFAHAILKFPASNDQAWVFLGSSTFS